jgi:hypothetical protein
MGIVQYSSEYVQKYLDYITASGNKANRKVPSEE